VESRLDRRHEISVHQRRVDLGAVFLHAGRHIDKHGQRRPRRVRLRPRQGRLQDDHEEDDPRPQPQESQPRDPARRHVLAQHRHRAVNLRRQKDQRHGHEQPDRPQGGDLHG
jgi:hypothetical protein